MLNATQHAATALVMHDDVWVRSHIVVTLGEAGLAVLAASNGATGVRMAEYHQPEVIVLGMALSEVAGADVLEQLHDCPRTKDIPVLVLSSRAADSRDTSAGPSGGVPECVALGNLVPEVARALHQPAPPSRRAREDWPARRRL